MLGTNQPKIMFPNGVLMMMNPMVESLKNHQQKQIQDYDLWLLNALVFRPLPSVKHFPVDVSISIAGFNGFLLPLQQQKTWGTFLPSKQHQIPNLASCWSACCDRDLWWFGCCRCGCTRELEITSEIGQILSRGPSEATNSNNKQILNFFKSKIWEVRFVKVGLKNSMKWSKQFM